MEMNEQKKAIVYSIKKINILDFGIKDTIHIKKKNQNELFNFNIEFKILFNIENKIIAIQYSHRVQSKNEPTIDIGWLKIQIDFYIKDIHNFINNSNKKVVVPNNFLGNLFDHVISTARGVWFTVMKGTILENAIVPLINTNELIQKENKK